VGWEAWITLAVVLATVVVPVGEWIPPALAVLAVVTVLLVAGVVEANPAFSGFSNTAPLTVAALYVLAAAVPRTRMLDGIVDRILGFDGSAQVGEPRVLGRLLAPTVAASALGFRDRSLGRRDFLADAPLDGEPPRRRDQAWIVACAALALFVLVGTGLLDVLPAALLVALALVALRLLSAAEARDAIDLNIVVLIAASFGLALR
jgi:di/tricarboxylate transporter